MHANAYGPTIHECGNHMRDLQTIYMRGVNQMLILNNSKDLLETLSSRSQYVCNIIKTFYFSTLYTTFPHMLLKFRIRELIQRCLSKKNGEQRYQNLVIGRDKSYFVERNSKSKNKYKQDEII